MIISTIVFDIEKQKFTGRNGEVNQTVLILQDNSKGSKLKQYLEFNMPDGAAYKEGDRLDISVGEIQSVFAGRPRIRGSVMQPAAK